jgi:hypothetical protein
MPLPSAIMAKYDALREHLDRHSSAFTMSFSDIADLVPGGLPPSAFKYSAWWSNENNGPHVQARAWLDAGYRVRADLGARLAHFEPS